MSIESLCVSESSIIELCICFCDRHILITCLLWLPFHSRFSTKEPIFILVSKIIIGSANYFQVNSLLIENKN